MVICPGGGYWNLAWDLEGEEVAAWLNTLGMTGVVLKYRVPRRPGQPEPLPAPGPLLDAQRAVSLVRSQAEEWGIDPNRIGIVGFSAGGHLAVMTATHFDKRAYEPIDDIDKVSCRPDFAVAVYPGYLFRRTRITGCSGALHSDSCGTPPIFLVHASDDPESGPEHSVAMYLALKRAGVPAELHVYAAGRPRLRRAQEQPTVFHLDGPLCRLAARPRNAGLEALTNRYVLMRNVTLTAVIVLFTCSTSFALETKPAKVVGPDATTGTAQAVVLDDVTLIQTTQLLPAESLERLANGGSAREQAQHLVSDLGKVLESAGSGLQHLVRANLYATRQEHLDELRLELARSINRTDVPGGHSSRDSSAID